MTLDAEQRRKLSDLRRQVKELEAPEREAAHIRSGYSSAGWAPTGMMQKPGDARAVPLCATCHREGPNAQHRTNEREWWAGHGIDPPDLCRALHSAYLAGEDGTAVLRRFSTQEAEQ